jgi:hypothetical protein
MNRQGMWLSTGLMAVLGALLGVRQVSPRLTGLVERHAAFAGGPTPRSLDWIAALTPTQQRLAALDGWLAAAAAVLALALAWRLVRLLNPHGTLVAPEALTSSSPRPALQTPLEQSLVRRCFAAAFLTVYLLGGVRWLVFGDEAAPTLTWGLSGLVLLWPERPWVGLGTAYLLGGAALWLLWGEWGAISPRQPRSTGRFATVTRGLLAGAAAAPVLLLIHPVGERIVDAMLAAVGPAEPAPWRQVLWGMTLGMPVAFGTLGIVGHALARPGSARASLIAPCLILLALLAVGEARLTATVLDHYDYGRDLAALVGAPTGPSSARTYLIFAPASGSEPLPGMVPYASIQHVDAGHDSARLTWQYLERRRYQTAASWPALVHLHDCASLRWDSAESLRVDLAGLERNPQPVFAGLLVDKLSTCATSRENLSLLQEAADPRRFRADPTWLRTLGLLFHRFGDQRTAEQLLHRSGLVDREVQQALQEEPPLTRGAVHGRVTVNGRPGAGLTAGLIPATSWQTLVGTPNPFELRGVAVAAPVAPDGRFRLEAVGQGDYVLIVMGDPRHLPLRGPGAHAEHGPGLLHLDRAHPSIDAGAISIRLPNAPAAT